MRRLSARTLRRFKLIALAGIILMMMVQSGWWYVTATATDYGGSTFNQGKNAIWLAHTWVGDPHSLTEYQTLFDRLHRHEIHYVFVHSGPLNGDGTVRTDRYNYAADFLRAAHQDAPDIVVLAWLGQVYHIGANEDADTLDLTNPATRQHIADAAGIFANRLGFAGVHLDIEPVPNNDNHFLDMLDAVRSVIGRTHLISIATPNWIPLARTADAIEWFTGRENVWWTTYYYQVVSKHADQIVVMLYNTGMPVAPLYTALVQQETARITRSVQRSNDTASVLIGIPTYKGSSRAFHDSAENMRSGLSGVIAGLNYGDYHPAFIGVAIYPEWLTTEDDWQVYDRLWLGE